MMIATRFFGIENLVLKEEKKLSKMFLRLLVYIITTTYVYFSSLPMLHHVYRYQFSRDSDHY